MHTLSVNNPLKVSTYIKCKLKHCISTMVVYGINLFEFSVSKDIKSIIHKKGGGNKERSGTFKSNTNCQGIENYY